MNLRSKAVITTIAFTFLYGVLQVVDLSGIFTANQLFIKAVFVAVFFFFGLYWVLGFNIRGVRFLSILGNPTLLIFINSLFLEVAVFQNIGRISQKTFSLMILGIFGFAVYFLILTMNILNVSYVSNIPLARAAKATNFIYTLLGSYFAFLLILKSGIGIPFQLGVFAFVTSFLTFNLFWYKKESVRQHLGETLAVIFCMLFVYIVLLAWPLNVQIAGMVLTVIFYILLGLGIEERETTSFLMRAEYSIILMVALFLLLKLAIWGINGPFI